jgi:hypothetical protein
MGKYLSENDEKLKGKFYSDYDEILDTKINIFHHATTFSLFICFFDNFFLHFSNKEPKNKHNEFNGKLGDIKELYA